MASARDPTFEPPRAPAELLREALRPDADECWAGAFATDEDACAALRDLLRANDAGGGEDDDDALAARARVVPVEWVVDVADSSLRWFLGTAHAFDTVEGSVRVAIPDAAAPTWEGCVQLDRRALRLVECARNEPSRALFRHLCRASTAPIDWRVEAGAGDDAAPALLHWWLRDGGGDDAAAGVGAKNESTFDMSLACASSSCSFAAAAASASSAAAVAAAASSTNFWAAAASASSAAASASSAARSASSAAASASSASRVFSRFAAWRSGSKSSSSGSSSSGVFNTGGSAVAAAATSTGLLMARDASASGGESGTRAK
mmetsp:Transcript_5562/g.17557  ORF Transcript_5562/g.17557 Transcript_5562/m.17557 type:complete len:319 (-) Transcript_5562:256-1212(-)